jgi:hypothetical protein
MTSRTSMNSGSAETQPPITAQRRPVSPPVRRTHRRLGCLFASVAVLALVVLVIRGCVFRPAAHHGGAAYNRGANAVWLGNEWVGEPRRRQDVAALAQDLRALQIRDVYVYAS